MLSMYYGYVSMYVARIFQDYFIGSRSVMALLNEGESTRMIWLNDNGNAFLA